VRIKEPLVGSWSEKEVHFQTPVRVGRWVDHRVEGEEGIVGWWALVWCCDLEMGGSVLFLILMGKRGISWFEGCHVYMFSSRLF